MQFSFKRFSYLFKLQLATNKKRYLLGIAALAGVLLVFMLSMIMDDDGMTFNNQQAIYVTGTLLSSAIFGTAVFGQYTRKSSRIQAIMLPASGLERLMVAIVQVLVLFPLVFTGVFMVCAKLMNYIDIYWLGHLNAIFLLNDGLVWGYLFFYFQLQALLLLGAIWFRKYAFVKTAVLVCLVAIGVVLANGYLGQKILKNIPAATRTEVMKKLPPGARNLRYDMVNPFGDLWLKATVVQDGRGEFEYYKVEPPPAGRWAVSTLLLLLPFVIWYITLLKLREQQL